MTRTARAAGPEQVAPSRSRWKPKRLSGTRYFSPIANSLSSRVLELLGPLLRLGLGKETARQVCRLPAPPLVHTLLPSGLSFIPSNLPQRSSQPSPAAHLLESLG